VIGFPAGLRRSELASLEVAQRAGAAGWFEQRPDGLAIRLAFSKTDQEAQGDVVGVPYASSKDICPVRAYRAWLGPIRDYGWARLPVHHAARPAK
jgi:hypothetical protein